ncbi:hypothetical protein RHGRI_006969 [Rhododendron griersonianum]|uniref:Sigma factor n=1 Tax=Rhododendron griersonianum TaxID=479676 RepID=A0AAV6KVI8_9ERIC|nr:hypothetical protein RHGRI_006969 [Rhododendron griersonianum]
MEITLQNMNIRTYVYTPMEAGRNLLTLSPPILPPQTHHRISSFCSVSVLMLHEQSARSLPFLATTSLAQHFPTSVVQQEQRDEGRSLLRITREDKTCQVILEKTREESESSAHEEDISYSYERLKDLERRILNLPALWYLSPSLQYGDLTSFSMLSGFSKTKRLVDVESHNVVALAKKALSASKQAALLADELHLFGPKVDVFRTKVDEFQTPSSTSTSFSNFPLEEVITVRSTRLLERRKKRGGPIPEVMVQETRNPPRSKSRRKSSKPYEPDNPVRNFLRRPEKKKLLTVQEETELFTQIHVHLVLQRLEELKSRLQFEVDREPTMAEWASAAGLSCQALKWQVRCGNNCRERIIYANSRMVVHIAKKYCGRGLNLEDLLQEGSGGLMRSVEKFKQRPGCRFSSYAYLWIKQAIRKAIVQHSRTIAIPESAYNLLYKVMDAKRLCIEDGNHQPKTEDIAARVQMTDEKLQRFLCSVRKPVSLDQPIWMDQDTTYQEITADPSIENPEVSMEKHFMKQHLRYLLSTLTPREQTIIRMRFGLEGSSIQLLSDIGVGFGICKERVRQLESKALSKLKRRLSSQDRDAYANLLRLM